MTELATPRIVLPPPGDDADPRPMSPETARALPAVAKCLSVITGLVMQMPMQAMKGRVIVEPTPTVLRDPDPTRDAASFVQSAVEDRKSVV